MVCMNRLEPGLQHTGDSLFKRPPKGYRRFRHHLCGMNDAACCCGARSASCGMPLCPGRGACSMAMPASTPTWQRALIVLTATMVSVVVVATLYWAQKLFIPLALAIYLAFLLNPLVRALERLRLGRVLSVLLAVSLMALVLVSIGWFVSQQVSGLVKDLPQYTSRFKAKIESLREAGRGTAWETLEKTERGLGGEPAENAPAGDTAPAPENPPK